MGSFLNPASFVYPRNGGVFGGSSAAPVNPLLVAVASTPSSVQNIMTSTDGITWTRRNTGLNRQWTCVAYSPALNRLLALSDQNSWKSISDDGGITWTSSAGPALPGGVFRGVAWSPTLGIFCAVGGAFGTVALGTSPDGITWTQRTPAAGTTQLNTVIWDDVTARFYAYGNGANERIQYSSDGITWNRIATALTGADSTNGLVIRAGSRLVSPNANNTNGLWRSPDGGAWALGGAYPTAAASGGRNTAYGAGVLFNVGPSVARYSLDEGGAWSPANASWNLNGSTGTGCGTFSEELQQFIFINGNAGGTPCGTVSSLDGQNWTLTPNAVAAGQNWVQIISCNLPIP